MDKNLKRSLSCFGIAIGIVIIWIFSGCVYHHYGIICTDVAISSARAAEYYGKKEVYLAIAKNKKHVQAFYLEDGKRIWLEIYGDRVQAGVARHSDVGEIITWEEAARRWYK